MGKHTRSIKYFLPILLLYGLLIGGGLYRVLLESFGYIPGLNMTELSWDYYRRALTANGFLRDLFFTLFISLVAATSSVILGLLMAYKLVRSQVRWLKLLVTRVMEFGLALPYLYMVFIVVLLFGKTGVYSRILYQMKLIHGLEQFPSLVFEPYGIGLLMVFILKGTPFVTLFLLNIMSSINNTYEDVAGSLGANPYQILRRIYLPLCSDTIAWTLMILLAYDIGAFEVPYLLGALKPQSLSVRLFSAYISPSIESYPLTMAIAMLLLIIGLIIVVTYAMVIKKFLQKKVGPSKLRGPKRYRTFAKVNAYLITIGLVMLAVLPSITIVLLSFNNFYRYPAMIPSHFTLTYWQNLLVHNSLFYQSIVSTLMISITSAILATMIGFLAGFGIAKHHRDQAKKYLLMVSLPLFIPGMSLFLGAHQSIIHSVFANHWTGVVLAHLLLCIPYSTNIAVAYFKGIPPELGSVAKTLGTSKYKRFKNIVLPLILPGLSLSASVAFLISNTEYFSTFLIGGGNTITLSMIMYPYIANNDYGMSGVTGIVFMALHLMVFLLLDQILKRKVTYKALYGME